MQVSFLAPFSPANPPPSNRVPNPTPEPSTAHEEYYTSQTILSHTHISQEKTLWTVLDKARQKVHSEAVKNLFLQKLVKGGFCQTEFMKYLVNLLALHQALEDAQKALLAIDRLSVFVFPELFRSNAIRQDLVIWKFIADEKFASWEPHPKTLEFADYIRDTSATDPEKIIAIMYTLYGTIMSGGQTNKRVVKDQLSNFQSFLENIPEGSGVALYEIDNVDNIAIFKQNWRKKLCLVKNTPENDVEDFYAKLSEEVIHTIKVVLEIIEKDVQAGHC